MIELIVVIVIMAILAAVALPRFTALQRDARIAKLNAARGSVAAAAALCALDIFAGRPLAQRMARRMETLDIVLLAGRGLGGAGRGVLGLPLDVDHDRSIDLGHGLGLPRRRQATAAELREIGTGVSL